MAFAVNFQRLAIGAAAIGAGAILLWFGTGLEAFWPLAWFAPLPILVNSLRNDSRWQIVLAAFLAWALGGLNLWNYLHGTLQIPVGIIGVLVAVPAVIFALAVLLFCGLVRRSAYWSALFGFPASWVAFEYGLSLISPHGTAGNLAYSQLNFLPLLQTASITGPWGMSYLLMLFPTALALAQYLRARAPRQARQIGGVSLGLIVAALIFGAVRLSVPTSDQAVRVGLIVSDAPQDIFVADEGAPTTALLTRYASGVEKLAEQGAKVIVLPEKLGVVVDPDTQTIDASLQSLADKHRVEIVTGLIHVTPTVKWNEARIYTPGAGIGSYHKEHLLPPFESIFARGTALTVVNQDSGKWGVAICKDMDFAQPSRDYGHAGVGLLLVPAWDFDSDRWWHGHMAIMRGVESGFSIARSAKRGLLTVSDAHGRILAEARSDSGTFPTLLVDAPARHVGTAYVLFGDWFAWVAIAMAAWSVKRLFDSRPRGSTLD
jgi:apolipoprotein N-acyltransferase